MAGKGSNNTEDIGPSWTPWKPAKASRSARRTQSRLQKNITKLPTELKDMILNHLPGFGDSQVGGHVKVGFCYKLPTPLHLTSKHRAAYAKEFFSKTVFLFDDKLDRFEYGTDWIVAFLNALTEEHRGMLTAVRQVSWCRARRPAVWETMMRHPVGDTTELVADWKWATTMLQDAVLERVNVPRELLQEVGEVYEQERPDDFGEAGHPYNCPQACSYVANLTRRHHDLHRDC